MSRDQSNTSCVKIENLKVHFPVRSGIMGKITSYIKAVDDISLSINKGEVFAIVGESGCGKSTTAQSIMGLVNPTSGNLDLAIGPWKNKPTDWSQLSHKERKQLRRHIQIIFQDPYSSLSPRMNIRSILDEPLFIHGFNISERKRRISELMDQVGLSQTYLNRYPHEFSGGQRQRISIARALATSPEFVVADEPVSALDVSIQAQIINLLRDLKEQYHQTMLFISHDLAVVRHMADRLAVMYLGKIVEMGSEKQIFSNPRHPYTHLLLQSVPTIKKNSERKTITISDDRKKELTGFGCPFYPRCERRTEECKETAPELSDSGSNHLFSCFNPIS
ncbi:Oligopeptide transport ATP-binding protein OppF [Chitinispirillum alkaliphilum]|nr:Oligopeptide transport ATP-binding protein OppF [Chitinispirillum alkaliphilum]